MIRFLFILLSFSFAFTQDTLSLTVKQPCTVTVSEASALQSAVLTAVPGAVVCALSGFYELSQSLQWNASNVQVQGPWCGIDPRNGDPDRPLPGLDVPSVARPAPAVLSGQRLFPGSLAEMNADGARLCGFSLQYNNATLDMVETESDYEVSNVAVDFNVLRFAGEEAIQLRDCSDCRVSYNVIVDSAEDGINVGSGSRRVLVEKNEIWRSRTDEGALQIERSRDVTVRENLVADSQTRGMRLGYCELNSSPSRDLVVERNLILRSAFVGVDIHGVDGLEMRHNVIRGTLAQGVSSSTGSAAHLIVRCNRTGDVDISLTSFDGTGSPASVYSMILGSPYSSGSTRSDARDSHLSGSASVAVSSSCLSAPVGSVLVDADNAGAPANLRGNWWAGQAFDDGQLFESSGSGATVPLTNQASTGGACPFVIEELSPRVAGTLPPSLPPQSLPPLAPSPPSPPTLFFDTPLAPSTFPGQSLISMTGPVDPGNLQGGGLPVGAAAGLAVGVLVVVCLLCFIGLYVAWRRQRLPESLSRRLPSRRSNRQSSSSGGGGFGTPSASTQDAYALSSTSSPSSADSNRTYISVDQFSSPPTVTELGRGDGFSSGAAASASASSNSSGYRSRGERRRSSSHRRRSGYGGVTGNRASIGLSNSRGGNGNVPGGNPMAKFGLPEQYAQVPGATTNMNEIYADAPSAHYVGNGTMPPLHHDRQQQPATASAASTMSLRDYGMIPGVQLPRVGSSIPAPAPAPASAPTYASKPSKPPMKPTQSTRTLNNYGSLVPATASRQPDQYGSIVTSSSNNAAPGGYGMIPSRHSRKIIRNQYA